MNHNTLQRSCSCETYRKGRNKENDFSELHFNDSLAAIGQIVLGEQLHPDDCVDVINSRDDDQSPEQPFDQDE